MPMSMSMGGDHTPPEVLKMRPWFIAVLCFQFVLMVLRFSMPDIWGGFYMLILLAIGGYAVKDGVNVMFTSYYGFMALITGIFDLVAFIDMMAKGMPFFLPGMFWRNIQVIGLCLSCPTCLVGAFLSYKIYSLNDAASLPYAAQEPSGGGGGGFFGGGTEYGTGGGAPVSRPTESFQAFQGSGNKLGAN